MEVMPRRLRIQYEGAIYHVMARGNGRQDIVRDDNDRRRLQEDLGRAAVRCSWRLYAFVILSNHLHLVLKTPEPNLARGMQGFLSSYANAWARRHRFVSARDYQVGAGTGRPGWPRQLRGDVASPPLT
jgi:REP-associated tyrosine transposase